MTNAHAAEPLDRDTAIPEPGSDKPDPEAAIKPPSLTSEEPDVGLSQKGLGEDAVIRRETEI